MFYLIEKSLWISLSLAKWIQSFLFDHQSAITLAAINTWMGDRLGRKINIHTQTCVCRNLYYSGLPLNIYRPKYLFQLKLCFQLKESISNYNLLLNIPKTLKYTYDTNWWCAVYRELELVSLVCLITKIDHNFNEYIFSYASHEIEKKTHNILSI